MVEHFGDRLFKKLEALDSRLSLFIFVGAKFKKDIKLIDFL